VDPAAVLAEFDEQVRRGMRSPPGHGFERDGRVVREVRDGWAAVMWSDLDEDTADAAIAAQIRHFRARGGRWEWKLHSYDLPPDLPSRLLAAGLRAEPEESVLVAAVDELERRVALPPGVELVDVVDDASVGALVALQDEVFGSSHPGMAEALSKALIERPPSAAALMALAGGTPVAGGRVEFAPDCEFAGLWGGCTHADWRGRGLFRALVARGTALAADRGYRWVHVDAAEASRPILLRVGFIEIAKTTPYVSASEA
jgi:GNAT superfamily N-acetyltransferase